MILTILIILIILFALGYIPLPFFPIHDIILFSIFGKTISLYDLLLFLLILWIIEVLPWPFRALATIIFLLWLLSFFGIIVIAGLSNILVLALILGMIAYLFQGMRAG